MAMGDWEFGRGLQLSERLRSRGLQHVALGRIGPHGTQTRVGAMTFGNPLSVTQRMVSRGKALQTFGVGALGADRPWYEAFFEHMENMAPVMSSFVLQLYGMYGAQRSSAWAQAGEQQRQAAYMDMLKEATARRSGAGGQMDNNTYQFLLTQMKSDPNRGYYFNQAAGGNSTLAQQLQGVYEIEAGIGWKAWVKNPLVILGAAAAAGVGIYFLVQR